MRPPQTLNFELIYLNVYFDVISFFQLIWFILNTGMTFLFWNHSIKPQHVFTSTQSASPRDEFWIVFMFLYLFIHSFTYSYFFYYYLFVSLYLIYINQVWHFCFESFNNSPSMYLLPLKVPHRKIEFWIVFMFIYLFIHFTYSYFFFYYYLFVSLNLIYINQVWHFCFEIVQKYRPFTSTQSASPQLRTLNWFI